MTNVLLPLVRWCGPRVIVERLCRTQTPWGSSAFARDRAPFQEPAGVSPQALSWVRACSSNRLTAFVTVSVEGSPLNSEA